MLPLVCVVTIHSAMLMDPVLLDDKVSNSDQELYTKMPFRQFLVFSTQRIQLFLNTI